MRRHVTWYYGQFAYVINYTYLIPLTKQFVISAWLTNKVSEKTYERRETRALLAHL